MLPAAFAMLFVSTLSPPEVSPSQPPSTAHQARQAVHGRRQVPAGAADLYSARAKRRLVTLLRLRLLELRRAGLDRVADVVEHRLSLQGLLDGP